jgi:hypothetical protein
MTLKYTTSAQKTMATPRWGTLGPPSRRFRGLREVGCGALRKAPPEDTVRKRVGATAVPQLDLSCSACHSIEPGAQFGFDGCRPTSLLLGTEGLGLLPIEFIDAPALHLGIEHFQRSAAGIDLVVMGKLGEAFEDAEQLLVPPNRYRRP